MAAIPFHLFADQLSQLAAAIDALCLILGERLAANMETPPAAALAALQAGDIAAQRVNHVAEAFAVLAGLPIPVDPELYGPGCRLQALQLRAATTDFCNGLAALTQITGLSADGQAIVARDGQAIVTRLETICVGLEASADKTTLGAGEDPAQRARLIDVLRPRYTMAAEHAILAGFLVGGLEPDAAEPSAETDDDLEGAFL
ncbi:hypothetical protein WCLP8_2900002 [uncultured Gammaproteobacteria bacterium]